jgi:hypothetical protein
MKKAIVVIVAILIALAAYAKTEKPKISRASAEKIALAMAMGTIEEGELEREKGLLVWSFDIRTGPNDITEVLVNANDGSIVAVEHETNASEKAEKDKEKSKAKEKAKDKSKEKDDDRR